jgi:hypothetical protein
MEDIPVKISVVVDPSERVNALSNVRAYTKSDLQAERLAVWSMLALLAKDRSGARF